MDVDLKPPTHPPRQAGWQNRLSDLVVTHLHQPFEWGRNDCATFVAEAVMLQHCADTLAPLRVPRRTARQAGRQARAAGGVDVLQRCGLQPVAPALAGRGDVLLLRQGRRYLLALCNGGEALAPGKDGLQVLPLSLAVQAWRT